MNWIFLIGGLVMGMGIGVVITALAVAAGQADDCMERLAASMNPNEDGLA